MSKFGEYVKSSYDELVHKVSWPSWKELQSSAVVVAIASIIIALIVFIMDYVTGVNFIPGSIESQDKQGFAGILGYLYGLLT